MAVRPTKKQKDILDFIDQFIKENGYSPTFREVMRGVGLTSVATASLHINSLIKRGHLTKREHSARSLEVVHSTELDDGVANLEKHANITSEIESRLKALESNLEQKVINEVYVLIGALHILDQKHVASGYSETLKKFESTSA